MYIRFRDSTVGHTRFDVFMRGAHCGTLTLKPEEGIWFHHIIYKGCDALGFAFSSSGKPALAKLEKIERCAKDMEAKNERNARSVD